MIVLRTGLFLLGMALGFAAFRLAETLLGAAIRQGDAQSATLAFFLGAMLVLAALLSLRFALWRPLHPDDEAGQAS